jgi:hypothetical protein
MELFKVNIYFEIIFFILEIEGSGEVFAQADLKPQSS